MCLRNFSIEKLILDVCRFIFRTLLDGEIFCPDDLDLERIEIMSIDLSEQRFVSCQRQRKGINVECTNCLALEGKLHRLDLTFG
jgi:hypothetical protein